MIFYTPIPLEQVFEGYEQMKLNYKEIQVGNVTMVVDQISDSESRIVRLISPNPQDYLNPQYQPGTVIQLSPRIP